MGHLSPQMHGQRWPHLSRLLQRSLHGTRSQGAPQGRRQGLGLCGQGSQGQGSAQGAQGRGQGREQLLCTQDLRQGWLQGAQGEP